MDLLVGEPEQPPLDELTADALAADPDALVPDDAVPFAVAIGAADQRSDLLPEWYMPAVAPSVHLTGWRRRVAWTLIVTFLLIVASGLCSTYGVLEIA